MGGIIMGDVSVLFSKEPCSVTDGKSMSKHYPCQWGSRTCGEDLGVCDAKKSKCLKATEEHKKKDKTGEEVAEPETTVKEDKENTEKGKTNTTTKQEEEKGNTDSK